MLDPLFAEDVINCLDADGRCGFPTALAEEDGTIGRSARPQVALLRDVTPGRFTLGRHVDDLADVLPEVALDAVSTGG